MRCRSVSLALQASFRLQRAFLVSREAAETFKDWDVEWDKVSKEYRDLMHERVNKALES